MSKALPMMQNGPRARNGNKKDWNEEWTETEWQEQEEEQGTEAYAATLRNPDVITDLQDTLGAAGMDASPEAAAQFFAARAAMTCNSGRRGM